MMNVPDFAKMKDDLTKTIESTKRLLDAGRPEQAFAFVFGQNYEELIEAFGNIDYCDPDASYEEDVCAKLGQLREYLECLNAVTDNETRD
jgi:hypothetical protein